MDNIITLAMSDNQTNRISNLETEKLVKNILANRKRTDVTILGFAVNKKIIDPDVFLFYCIKHINNVKDLCLVSAILKLGADPNMYINGMHIVPYIFVYISKKNIIILKHLYIILKAYGANLEYQASTISKTDITFFEKEKVLRLADIPVNQFMKNNNFIDYNEMVIEDQILLTILINSALSTDDINRAENSSITGDGNTTTYHEFIIDMMIDSLSYGTFASLPFIPNRLLENEKMGESIIISRIIRSGNPTFLELAMKKGINISYFSMNFMIVNLMYNLGILYKKMIIMAIRNGAYLDTIQYKRIVDILTHTKEKKLIEDSVTGELFTEQIKREYMVPRWKKMCNAPEMNIREIRNISIKLGFGEEINEVEICQRLKEISNIDQNEIIKHMGCSNEFNTFFTNAQITRYQDIDGYIWCITSDLYNKVLSERINPYNGKLLPDEVVTSIRKQIEAMASLGVDLKPPKIYEDDQITDETSLEICSKVEKSFALYNYQLKTTDIKRVLGMLKINAEISDLLGGDLGYVTLCRAIYIKSKKDFMIYEKIVS